MGKQENLSKANIKATDQQPVSISANKKTMKKEEWLYTDEGTNSNLLCSCNGMRKWSVVPQQLWL